jgi:hypothetical protein
MAAQKIPLITEEGGKMKSSLIIVTVVALLVSLGAAACAAPVTPTPTTPTTPTPTTANPYAGLFTKADGKPYKFVQICDTSECI